MRREKDLPPSIRRQDGEQQDDQDRGARWQLVRQTSFTGVKSFV
jgi:hypothetical protein